GLIAGILEPLYSGIPATLMPPFDFIERPARWVEGMSKYRCTSTGGPNFAFELCALKTSDEQVKTLDLRDLEVAANGAEPISRQAMSLFYQKFKPAGLRKGVILPCYGLAESTVMVTGKPFLKDELMLSVDPQSLKKNKVVICENHSSTHPLVSSGIPHLKIKIVNPDTLTQCEADEVGEIWIQGGSVASGYYHNPEETQKTFHAKFGDSKTDLPYLRSGDLGFLYKGELFVCGRIKNLIVIRGQNHYPHDIEYAVSYADDAIRKGCVVAYAKPHNNHESLVIVAEVRNNTSVTKYPALIEAINKALGQQCHLSAHQILFVPAKTIPKTSSGKLQRLKCQELIENQHIKPLWHFTAPNHAWMDDLCVDSISHSLEINVTPVGHTNKETWLTRLESTPEELRDEVLTQEIRLVLAEILNVANTNDIDMNTEFFELGMDSIMAVEIKNKLQRCIGSCAPLPSTIIFEQSTLYRLKRYLAEKIFIGIIPPTPTVTNDPSLEHQASMIEEGLNGFFIKKGNIGVLIIHGVTGTPGEMKELATALTKNNFTIALPQLEGHCSSINALKESTHENWYASVNKTLNFLEKHCDTIFVTGLSAGSLLAIKAGIQSRAKIAGVILLSPLLFCDGWNMPFYKRLALSLMINSPLRNLCQLKTSSPYGVKKESVRLAIDTLVKSSTKNNATIIGHTKIPGTVFYEISLLINEVKQSLLDFHLPTLIIHSLIDDLASKKNAGYLKEHMASEQVDIKYLDDCYHLITLDNQKDLVFKYTIDFINTLTLKKIESPSRSFCIEA
ncbi:MAG: serine aminopeptidase domain-containing protein, partial [Legionellaceae bacterium]